MKHSEARYSVADLWEGLNPHGVERGLFMVFKCYIDESYDEKLFVLSCTIADGARWTAFEQAWRGVLDEKNAELRQHGRQELSRYHATYCAGMSGEFKGWDVEEQKTFTARLLDAAKTVPTHTVAHTIVLNDVRDTFTAKYGVAMHHDNQYAAVYFFAMQHCMMMLGRYMYALNPHLRIAFIHDHSDYDAAMLLAFNRVKYELGLPYADMFATIAPMSSKECLPLQLADFVAYEFFKDRGGEVMKGDKYKRRKSLALALETGMGVQLHTIKRDWIEEIVGFNSV